VIWYTAMFSTLSFLTGPMRVEAITAQLIVGGSALLGLGWFILFGALSDRIGRRKPIIWGYALTLVLLFPLFWLIGHAANQQMAAAAARAGGDPARSANAPSIPSPRSRPSFCGRMVAELNKQGVPYSFANPPEPALAMATAGPEALAITVGDRRTSSASRRS
jgi:MFS family permease